MLTRYYEAELRRLRDLAADFAAAHPALAPMLGGPSADPDVERLLEGVAFQNGALRQKLDDDFPELIHDLARLVCPQYLRPVPAATIVAFSPRASVTESHAIRAGTELSSAPIGETRCLFRTCCDVDLHPLEIVDASFVQSSRERSAVTLSFALHALSLDSWSPRTVRLFLADEYPRAAELYLLLRRHLREIVLAPEEGGSALKLPPECLQPAGLRSDEALFPYPSHAFPAYRLLQEYFALPQRFLFLDVTGWESWVEKGHGSRFTVRFELSPFAMAPPRVRRESFVLFAAPAVNLFSHDADPIVLDHRKERYLVRPAGLPPHHVQIFSVDEVTGFLRGGSEPRTYRPIELFDQTDTQRPLYHASLAPRADRPDFDVYLDFPSLKEGVLMETLSIHLTCTNGSLPEELRVGDLCHPTASSPEGAIFRNITTVASATAPPLGKNLLWRLVSHRSVNHFSLANAGQLKALLNLYLFSEESQLHPTIAANRKRIDAIEEVVTLPVRRLVRGIPVHGTEVRIRIAGDHFAGRGDLFIFACVLDHLFAAHASLNTFSKLTIDTTTDGATEFPPRLGEIALL